MVTPNLGQLINTVIKGTDSPGKSLSGPFDSRDKGAENTEKDIGRREFLIGALGASIGGVCLLESLGTGRVLADSTTNEKIIIYDSTKCILCHSCELSCKQCNGLEGELDFETSDLSADVWLKMVQIEPNSDSDFGPLFIRRACMHCGNCVSVCPAGAISQREDGFVVVDQDKCIGCHYCHQACPFDIPRYSADGTMQKCITCVEEGNEEPACVSSCPVNALTYGNRDELLAAGRERVEALIDDGYEDAYLYGDEEMGGMPLMYVLGHPPVEYGLPSVPKTSIEPMTWQNALPPLGVMLGGLALLGGGIKYIMARKQRNANLADNE